MKVPVIQRCHFAKNNSFAGYPPFLPWLSQFQHLQNDCRNYYHHMSLVWKTSLWPYNLGMKHKPVGIFNFILADGVTHIRVNLQSY